MHLEILDEKRIELLKKLNDLKIINDFVLGGGTSISLQLGLRESFDFDFFTSKHFDIDELLYVLKENFGNVKVIKTFEPKSTLDVFIGEIKVSFLEYTRKQLYEPINFDGFENIKLLSLLDLVGMKSVAIAQRGTIKDFFDLYFLINTLNISAKDLCRLLVEKFDDKNILISFVYSIAYFDDAHLNELPKTFVNFDWEEIKKYFINMQKEIKKIL